MAHASEDKPLVADRPAAPDKSPIFEFLDGAFQGLISRRQERWNQQVAATFDEIRAGLDAARAESRLTSEHFLTVVTEATLIACRNHDPDKIAALRNAILHTGLGHEPEEPVQLLFLRLIDYLTPLHLVVMILLADPVKWMARHEIPNPRWPVGTSSTVIQYCLDALRGRPDLVEMIVRDLQGAGLVEQGHFLRMPMSDEGMLQSRATDSGRQFVRYITHD